MHAVRVEVALWRREVHQAIGVIDGAVGVQRVASPPGIGDDDVRGGKGEEGEEGEEKVGCGAKASHDAQSKRLICNDLHDCAAAVERSRRVNAKHADKRSTATMGKNKKREER